MVHWLIFDVIGMFSVAVYPPGQLLVTLMMLSHAFPFNKMKMKMKVNYGSA